MVMRSLQLGTAYGPDCNADYSQAGREMIYSNVGQASEAPFFFICLAPSGLVVLLGWSWVFNIFSLWGRVVKNFPSLFILIMPLLSPSPPPKHDAAVFGSPNSNSLRCGPLDRKSTRLNSSH